MPAPGAAAAEAAATAAAEAAATTKRTAATAEPAAKAAKTAEATAKGPARAIKRAAWRPWRARRPPAARAAQSAAHKHAGEKIGAGVAAVVGVVSIAPPWARRDRKSTRLNSSHPIESRMPASA